MSHHVDDLGYLFDLIDRYVVACIVYDFFVTHFLPFKYENQKDDITDLLNTD